MMRRNRSPTGTSARLQSIVHPVCGEIHAAIGRSQVRRTPQDKQLMFDRQRFCRNCAKTARPGQPREGHQQVGDQAEQQTH
jgi:hypothetical protein